MDDQLQSLDQLAPAPPATSGEQGLSGSSRFLQDTIQAAIQQSLDSGVPVVVVEDDNIIILDPEASCERERPMEAL
jgi:hypothetical protein